MTARRVAAAVGSAGGWNIVRLASVESTMNEARRLAAAGAAELSVVRADVQTGGRGRLGRNWASPVGNVYSTAILRPAIPTHRAAELSLVAAVAVADTVARFAEPVRLKWPNDALLDGAKVAGILLESVIEGAELSAVLVGIGINVATAPELPDRPTARIANADADTIFTALLEALEDRYRQWRADGFGNIREAWLARGPDLGAPVTVGQGNERIEGRFAGLGNDGVLLIELAGGGVRRVASGDVIG